MTTGNAIRMSDYQRPKKAIAPMEATRQFRISIILAFILIMASTLVIAATLTAHSHTLQALSVAMTRIS